MQGQDFLVPFGGAGHPGDCQKELAQQRETKVSEHSEKGLALFRHLVVRLEQAAAEAWQNR
ncbi:hypothetical protein [Stutzerimonas balearica]|uniref:hypothetical protein n=1 Tax=Stutzerimonas balearica TaxID=74829 RepID=UPI0028AEF753|nr:hypothetical protein [Stutzerimonas balearica]